MFFSAVRLIIDIFYIISTIECLFLFLHLKMITKNQTRTPLLPFLTNIVMKILAFKSNICNVSKVQYFNLSHNLK